MFLFRRKDKRNLTKWRNLLTFLKRDTLPRSGMSAYLFVSILHIIFKVFMENVAKPRFILILFSSGKILFLTRENKVHIFKPPCNFLFIV